MRILFASSEVHPLMKTGGLADVSAGLPRALQGLGHDVRILMPAYRDTLRAASAVGAKLLITHEIDGTGLRLFETRLLGTRTRVWLLDCPPLYDRPGNPYLDRDGHDYTDNAERFLFLSRVAAALSCDELGLGWRPEVLHCNDWQTALAPLLLRERPARPASIFTIHNLAYQGLFPYPVFERLRLPESLWHPDALEFHDNISFIKSGLIYADRVTTVSPRYAQEIQTEEFGHGLDGVLRQRSPVLSGILNGIDAQHWNPARDTWLAAPYDVRTLERKRLNKTALLTEMGLDEDTDVPLLAFIGRLVEQKGVDLLLAVLPALLLENSVRIALLGSGAARYESAWRALEKQHPGRISVRIGYDEGLAHRIEAGADIFLMPSRFEPCGLNQMYSLRYGTVPIVSAVGGLADTVVDVTPTSLTAATANGFYLHGDDAAALLAAIRRAEDAYHDPVIWKRLQTCGMRQDFSWRHSAREYESLYRVACAELTTAPA